MRWPLLVSGIALTVALMVGSKSALAIGIRAKNPLNIKWNKANNWLGQIGYLTALNGIRYCEFSDEVYCFRAVKRLMLNYQSFYGLKTVRQMISRYAQDDFPESDRDQPVAKNYPEIVAAAMGIEADDEIRLADHPDLIVKMLAAMNRVEVPVNFASLDVVKSGVAMA